MEQGTLTGVSMVLAIGSILMPIVFGYVLWQMSKVFVTKEDYMSWKAERHLKDAETREAIQRIDSKIDRLLERK